MDAVDRARIQDKPRPNTRRLYPLPATALLSREHLSNLEMQKRILQTELFGVVVFLRDKITELPTAEVPLGVRLGLDSIAKTTPITRPLSSKMGAPAEPGSTGISTSNLLLRLLQSHGAKRLGVASVQ